MSDGFQKVLDHIRSVADTQAGKGRLFERLMKAYFVKDPPYAERFSKVWLWSEWAVRRPGFDGGVARARARDCSRTVPLPATPCMGHSWTSAKGLTERIVFRYVGP